MARLSCMIRHLWQGAGMLCTLILDATQWLRLCLRSPTALAAENLFLRKQLALYQKGHVKPRRATDAIRVALVWLSQWFDWPQALTVVQPETFIRWRRQGFERFWRGTPSPGRSPIPVELQALIRQMARDNLTWGQRRVANELRLKLGLQVSPRTVRKYMPTPLGRAPGHRVLAQRWRTFVRNHAWDLIVRGVASDLARGAQALAARLRWLLQRCRGRTVTSGWHGIPPCDATCLAPLGAPASGFRAWSPAIVEVIRMDERSPPDFWPSCAHAPGLATRTTSRVVKKLEITVPTAVTPKHMERLGIDSRFREASSRRHGMLTLGWKGQSSEIPASSGSLTGAEAGYRPETPRPLPPPGAHRLLPRTPVLTTADA